MKPGFQHYTCQVLAFTGALKDRSSLPIIFALGAVITMVRDSGASKSSMVQASQQTIGKDAREGGSSSGPRDRGQFSEREDSDFKSLPPLPPISARTNGSMYQYKGKMCMWLNNSLRCEHGRVKSRCKECGGSGICEHGRQKSRCKECGRSGLCEHGRQKSRCKECGGSAKM